MPIIDGVVRNPKRTRFYGLDVGDRVKRTPFMGQTTVYGNVVALGPMDNNRVQVLWDGNENPNPEVAEWCTRIDENGLEINTIVWRIAADMRRGISIQQGHIDYMLKKLNITEADMIKAFKSYPGYVLTNENNEWILIYEDND